MKNKKILSLFLAVCLCLTVAGCGEKTQNPQTDNDNSEHTVLNDKKMQLLYSSSDSFNPYTAQTAVNRELCGLLYDSLTKNDNNFNPVNCLASSVEISGNSCTVVLKDVLFTDGSPVTADDVVYSCNLARNTVGAVSAAMYEITSVSAKDSKTVVFSLAKNDPYFANLLDFPILKSGTDKIADVDGVLQPPIGCGRFKLNESADALLRNEGYYGEKTPISQIKLINSPDMESISHYVEIGATDAYYTDTYGTAIVRMSGKKVDINLNDLVYIGINDGVALLKEPNIRYAISSSLNRNDICKTAFYNNANPANGFFNPVFEDTKAVQTIKNVSDFEIAIENLEKIGYNSLDSTGFRVNQSGYRLRFNLLVNSQNTSALSAAHLIKEQLKGVGIEINVIERGYDDYISMLQSGNFEMYIGEIRILQNMDISPLVIPGGSASYGVSAPVTVKDEENSEGIQDESGVTNIIKVFEAYNAGNAGLVDIAAVLQTQLPCIPVCYREGLLFYDDKVCNLSGASLSDIYFSIENKN